MIVMAIPYSGAILAAITIFLAESLFRRNLFMERSYSLRSAISAQQ